MTSKVFKLSDFKTLIDAFPYQVFNGFHELLLGRFDSFLLSDDCNKFLVFITLGGEHNPRPSVLAHLSDVRSSAANQETMMLGFCTNLSCETVGFLWH